VAGFKVLLTFPASRYVHDAGTSADLGCQLELPTQIGHCAKSLTRREADVRREYRQRFGMAIDM
jgi:hypothetical protein